MFHKFHYTLILLFSIFSTVDASAQLDWMRAGSALVKTVQAVSITDAKMASYVKESVRQMDAQNKVMGESDPHTVRLRKLTAGITSADGIPLNFKVYNVKEVNAFACPDGSVRVYSALMDAMTDDELLGVIGHEIGHVVKRHSKNAFKQQLLTGALADAIASTGGRAAALTDSQLGVLSQALLSAKYSQKQEKEADNCGYDFLKAHGRNPWGMVMAFEKLQQIDGNAGASNYISRMFSSHPETKSRIDALSKRCKKDGIARPSK